MARRTGNEEMAGARDFADAVDRLVSAAIRGEEPPDGASPEATRLAAAFVLLDRLVGQYRALPTAVHEGAAEAEKVLLSLRSGYEHPVWTYVSGVRTKHRLSRKLPVEELRRRAYTVGCMEELKRRDGLSVRGAATMLAGEAYYRRHRLAASALRKWPEALQEPPAIKVAEDWRQRLMTEARDGADAVRLTTHALTTLEEADRLPSLAAAATRRPMFLKLADGAGNVVGEIAVTAPDRPLLSG
jgi:hypothetical protein